MVSCSRAVHDGTKSSKIVISRDKMSPTRSSCSFSQRRGLLCWQIAAIGCC